MGKPSLYKQVDAVPIAPTGLLPSPRHWNPGLFRHAGKLWMAYRYHRGEAAQRCGTAIVALDEKTLQPAGRNSPLKFSTSSGTYHHEDARLFTFLGEPHISYTEMSGYRPGVDYSCVMKYARLEHRRGYWSISEEFHPEYGRNNGQSKEKNWVFFENANRLHFVYSIAPQHIVVELQGSKAMKEYRAPGPIWTFGDSRGGTTPLKVGDRWLSLFHSSVATEEPPHFVRYVAGAYEFAATPPFAPLSIGAYPLMAGSEEDGHKVDPRYVEGWKPYVVFPCGLVDNGDHYLTSIGVNDWQCAVARIPKTSIKLGPADGSGVTPRYFRTANGSIAIRFMSGEGRVQLLTWSVFNPGRGGVAGAGYMKLTDPRVAQEVFESPNVVEINEAEYEKAVRGIHSNPSFLFQPR